VREEEYVNRDLVFTPKEPWIDNRGPDHWYAASTAFAKEVLALFPKGNCLVIGSPLMEVEALQAMGWRVTYLDIRIPPVQLRDFVQADATEIPFPDGTFDAVSSSCVVCHVGLGRYGDKVLPDADEKMLREISRVMKPGAPAVITFGPVSKRELSVRHGNIHRVYTVKEVKRLADQAGLEDQELRIWDAVLHKWVLDADHGIQPSKYVSTVLRHK
jgi:SAM-dependent methyltransferase